MKPHDLADLPTASHRSTNDLVFALIESNLRPNSMVLDLGCGVGHMSRRIGRWFSSRGVDPATRVMATDISRDRFSAPEVRFVQMDARHQLPIADASVDFIVSIEVIEHISQPYEFLDQCRRLLKPGGMLVFSTPNVGNLQSRVRTLFMGLPSLYEMPSIDPAKAGRLCGHIMPLNWAYIAYGLRRSKFASFTLHMDQQKNSSTILYFLLWPFLWLGNRRLLLHTRRYDMSVYQENRQTLLDINSRLGLTSRSLVVQAIA